MNDITKYAWAHIPKTGGTSFARVTKNAHNIKELGHAYSFETPQPPGWIWGKYYESYNRTEYDKIFTIVRNPFDVLISYYTEGQVIRRNLTRGWGNVNAHHGFKSWEQFLKAYLNPEFKWHFPRMKQSLFSMIYDENWDLNIDFYFKLENPTEINDFLKKHNLPILPHLNKSERRVGDRVYYTSSQVDELNKIWKRDLDYFNYKYENQ